MDIRVTVDQDGFPTAFYPSDVWPSGYPESAFLITSIQWKDCIENQGLRKWNGSDFVVYTPPDPGPPPSTPELYAIADISIADGAITSVTTSAQISAVFYIDVGTYWVFFAESQANTNYIPLCYNHNHTVFVSEKTEDFFVVSALAGGVASDPMSLSVEVKRVQ